MLVMEMLTNHWKGCLSVFHRLNTHGNIRTYILVTHFGKTGRTQMPASLVSPSS